MLKDLSSWGGGLLCPTSHPVMSVDHVSLDLDFVAIEKEGSIPDP